MSYRQGYTELEGQFSSVVGNTIVSGLNFAMSGLVVDNAELAVGACSGAAVASGGIALPHMANASVSGLHLVAQGIGADRILNNALTATQLAVGVASGAVIGSVSVGLQHHANASVSGLHIVAQGIGADRILNNAVTATQLAVGVASGAVIGSTSVGLQHLANASVSGLHFVAQGIGADRILNAAITATQMANASISGLHLVAQGVGADRILNASLTATQMANNAASGLIVSAGFGVISAGSPAAVGNSAYAGTGATAGGSDAWVLYPGVTFGAAPNLVLQNNQAAGVTFFVPTGSITVGSFYVQSSAASSSFTYLAIGSGRSP